MKILITTKTAIIIENHYLASVIKSGQFDTFYHEHPRTYSVKSFTKISESFGLKINNIEFPKRYGGNIRVFMSSLQEESISFDKLKKLIKDEQHFIDESKNWNERIDNWKDITQHKLKELQKKGIKLPEKRFLQSFDYN